MKNRQQKLIWITLNIKGDEKIIFNDHCDVLFDKLSRTQTFGRPIWHSSISRWRFLVTLISNPKAYHGNTVRIRGYLNLQFEGDAIYLHQEDYEKVLTLNGLWLIFSGNASKSEYEQLTKGYVVVEGTFNMNHHGHGGLYSGAIQDTTSITKWGN